MREQGERPALHTAAADGTDLDWVELVLQLFDLGVLGCSSGGVFALERLHLLPRQRQVRSRQLSLLKVLPIV